MTNTTCSIDGCDDPVVARGWCSKHYQRWKLRGDPEYTSSRTDPRQHTGEPCAADGCTTPTRKKDWCGTHYARWLNTGTIDLPPKILKVCKIEGCEKVVSGLGWCTAHYLRNYRFGDPLGSGRPTLEERFWDKVEVGHPLGCWIWTAATSHGYGMFGIAPKKTRHAHRVAYEFLVGPIGEGLHIDHLCRNPPCVNPDHLEPVTPFENSRRSESRNARNARKTRCMRGHAFTEANTYRPPTGGRQCRTCALEANRRRQSRSV